MAPGSGRAILCGTLAVMVLCASAAVATVLLEVAASPDVFINIGGTPTLRRDLALDAFTAGGGLRTFPSLPSGADLIAHHVDGHDKLVQVKGRFTLRKFYTGKNLWVAFPHGGGWYLYPHDRVQKAVAVRNPKATGYSWPRPPKWALQLLEPFRIDREVKDD